MIRTRPYIYHCSPFRVHANGFGKVYSIGNRTRYNTEALVTMHGTTIPDAGFDPKTRYSHQSNRTSRAGVYSPPNHCSEMTGNGRTTAEVDSVSHRASVANNGTCWFWTMKRGKSGSIPKLIVWVVVLTSAKHPGRPFVSVTVTREWRALFGYFGGTGGTHKP